MNCKTCKKEMKRVEIYKGRKMIERYWLCGKCNRAMYDLKPQYARRTNRARR